MPYIGKAPVSGGFHKLDNLTASATATYALTLGGAAYYPETANQLLVSLNGVIQAPQDSFTVSGSNLIFDSALTASDSIDFVMALGDVLGVGTPTDGTITTAKIGNGAVTDAKIDTMAASKLTGSIASTSMPTGSILQVVNATSTTPVSTTSSSFADTGFSASITPSSTSSKILLLGNFTCHANTNGLIYKLTAYRDGTTNLGHATWGFSWIFGASSTIVGECAVNYLDSPATTSSVTYNIYHAISGSGTGYFTYNGARSGFTLMEIAG